MLGNTVSAEPQPGGPHSGLWLLFPSTFPQSSTFMSLLPKFHTGRTPVPFVFLTLLTLLYTGSWEGQDFVDNGPLVLHCTLHASSSVDGHTAVMKGTVIMVARKESPEQADFGTDASHGVQGRSSCFTQLLAPCPQSTKHWPCDSILCYRISENVDGVVSEYLFLFCCMCECLLACVCLCTTCVSSTCRVQKRPSDLLELELEQLWAALWVLESNVGPLAASALNQWAIAPGSIKKIF